MNGIQLAGGWGSRVSEARLNEISQTGIEGKDVTREFGEWLLDCLGLSDHQGAFKAVQDLARARATLIELKEEVVSDSNEHKFLTAFEKAACAAEDLKTFVRPEYKSLFSVFRNASTNGKLAGGDIVIAGLGDNTIFECHFHPNSKSDKFYLATDYKV